MIDHKRLCVTHEYGPRGFTCEHGTELIIKDFSFCLRLTVHLSLAAKWGDCRGVFASLLYEGPIYCKFGLDCTQLIELEELFPAVIYSLRIKRTVVTG